MKRAVPFSEATAFGISYAAWTVCLIVVMTGFRIYVAIWGGFDLAAEEMHYWDWSRTLRFSYFSKPPLTSYLMRVSCMIFGNNIVGVRAVALSISALLPIVTWILVREIGGSPRKAFLSILMLNLVPLYAVGAILTTTDTPLMLFWAVCLLCIYRAIRLGSARWWYAAGAAFGFGMLAKYAMIYLLVCLVIFFVIQPRARKWLRRPQPYIFLAIGIAMFAQVIVWNAMHDWATVRHVAGDAKVGNGLAIDLGSLAEYIGTQFLLANPATFLIAFYGLWKLIKRRRPLSLRVSFLVAFSFPVFFLILLKSIQGSVLGNWAAPAYYAMTVFAVFVFDRMLIVSWRDRSRRRRLNRIAQVAIGFPAVALLFLQVRPVYTAMERSFAFVGVKLPVALNPAYNFIGWKEMAVATGDVLAQMPHPDRTFVYTWAYQINAAVDFYVPGQPHSIGIPRGHMNQYILWDGYAGKAGWDAICVAGGGGHGLHSSLAREFARIEGPYRLYIDRHGELFHDAAAEALPQEDRLREFTYYKCYDFSGAFSELTEQKAEY